VGVLSQHSLDRGANDCVVMLFQPVIEKLAGDLDSKSAASKIQGGDRLEPSLETLCVDLLFYQIEASSPDIAGLVFFRGLTTRVKFHPFEKPTR